MCQRDEGYPEAICPVCESTDVIPVGEPKPMLKCKKCGYAGDKNMFWTRSER